MMVSSLLTPSARTFVRAGALTALVGLAACSGGGDSAAPKPVLPGNTPTTAQLQASAFVFDVSTANKTVTVTGPASKINALLGSDAISGNRSAGTTGKTSSGVSYSILAGDVVQLTTSNYTASTVGQFTPNKVRVTFDVSITNKLSGVSLITPTFPAPPAGANGVILFPFSTTVTTTSGGTTVGGDGTVVIVEQPNRGATAPSTDWNGDGTAAFDGSPFSFFNDASCSVTPAAGTTSDCYRYELFGQPVVAGGTTLARTVGFDIDPTVANFRARLILAADLANSGPAPTNTVSGTVTSPQRGVLSGVTATVNGGGFTGTTDGTGAYSITGVTTGPKTVTLTGLPTGCTDPGAQSITVNASPAAGSTANFSVTCTAAVGTVAGTITRAGTGTQSFAAVTVTATPSAASTTASSAVITGSGTAFAYSLPAVQVGTGTGVGAGALAVTNLPSGCTAAPTAGSYTGLTQGGTVAGTAFTITCVAPPALFTYASTWSYTAGATTATVTISFDPTTGPATVSGEASNIASFGAIITYPTARLSNPVCGNVTGSTFAGGNGNVLSAGTLSVLNFKNGAGATTLSQILQCTFTVSGTGAATIQLSTDLSTGANGVFTFNGTNIGTAALTQKNEGVLTLQ
jgi:hypothetical protein